MTAPHPLAARWQPSQLFDLATLAQSVASHAEAAITASDVVEAIRAAGRFGQFSERLQARLQPFADHDLDQPDTWPPSADPRLLMAILELRACLEHLLPDRGPLLPKKRGRKTKLVFDPEMECLKLKGSKPVVARLLTLVAEVKQLVGERLTRPVQTDTLATPVAGPSVKQPEDETKEATLIQNAVALILANPDWSVDQYAEKLSCHRSTLYRYPTIKAALQSRHGSKRDLPRGFKDGKGGMDAWGEDEDD